jgi:hypothetical protein
MNSPSLNTPSTMNTQRSGAPRMARFVKLGAWLLLAGVLLSALLIGVAWQAGSPFDGAVLNIDGDSFALSEMHAGHGLLALGGVLLALIVVLLLLPFAVIVPLLCAAFGIAVALFAVLGVAALLLSPLLLFVWVLWRLARNPSPRAKGDATIGA